MTRRCSPSRSPRPLCGPSPGATPPRSLARGPHRRFRCAPLPPPFSDAHLYSPWPAAHSLSVCMHLSSGAPAGLVCAPIRPPFRLVTVTVSECERYPCTHACAPAVRRVCPTCEPRANVRFELFYCTWDAAEAQSAKGPYSSCPRRGCSGANRDHGDHKNETDARICVWSESISHFHV